MPILNMVQIDKPVHIPEKFVTDIATPCFEEGLLKKEERAFALLGTVSNPFVNIKEWIKVPENIVRGTALNRYRPNLKKRLNRQPKERN